MTGGERTGGAERSPHEDEEEIGLTIPVRAYQHGIYPHSETLVRARRDLDRHRTTPEEVDRWFEKDLEDLVAVQRDAALDYFSDGMLRWQDIFRPIAAVCAGIESGALVRWFSNNAFYRAPEVDRIPTLVGIPEELADAGEVPMPRVATLPSPYMFSRAASTSLSRDQLMVGLASEALAPLAADLAGRGYEVVHLQEPWLAYFGIDDGAWEPFAEALGAVRDAVAGRAALVLHTYFGDASPHADRLRRLPVDAVGIDFVETDLDGLGADWEVGVLVGGLDGRRSLLERGDEVVAFAERVADRLRPPIMYLSSNSDLETLPRDLASEKVLRLGAAARRLEEVLA
jgi:5-methyltetrahydropteroyltriglutamate--homocysteine methyltransferase